MVATNTATNASAVKNSRRERKIWRCCAGAIALAATLSLAGCYGAPLSPRESDTLIGGAVGAGGGALVGSAVGSPGTGAVVGGLGGAGLGYIIGNHIQNEYGYGYGYGPHGGWRGGY